MTLHTPVHRWRYALVSPRFSKEKKMSNCAFPRAVASFLYRESRPVARLLHSKPHVKIFMLYLPLKFGINKMPLPVQVFNFQVSQTDCIFALPSGQRLLKPNIGLHQCQRCNVNASWSSTSYVSLANFTVPSYRAYLKTAHA